MIIIDNYDSFTYNLVQYVKILGIEPKVFLSDKVTIKQLEDFNFSKIIISPGPGNPSQAGMSKDIIQHSYKEKKILGVCLGHQCIAEVFGGITIKANEPVHGKVSVIKHNGDKIFRRIPEKFNATRYHSLIIDPRSIIGTPVDAIAKCDDIIMAVKHSNYDVYGVQYHPESIMTDSGMELLKNFIEM